LVTHGVFAFSRNPMYLSMMLGLLGVFVALGSLTPLAAVPVFFLIIRRRFIAVEERMLEEAFGDDYRAYKSRVRRWL
jgi:protein-S-isoprenylcysteine O-methyltransferase Ste14